MTVASGHRFEQNGRDGMTDIDGGTLSHRSAGIEYEWIPRLRAEPHRGPSCVAIGMFDGVHRGHRSLLQLARAHADRSGCQLIAVTFDVHPRSALSPAAAVPLLQTPLERYRRLLAAGADAVMALSFSRALAAKTPTEFLDFLCAETQLGAVFVGEDFRFGAKRAGDCDLLERQGAQRGFDVTVVPPLSDGDRAISSTRIRKAIAKGAIEEATSLLGAAHQVTVRALAFDSRRQVAMFSYPPEISKPPSGAYLARIRPLPYVPVTVELSEEPELSRIWHTPEEPVHSLSSLYASPVTLEFLDIA